MASLRRLPAAARRGAAAIETALCAPVLVALLSGVVDWGWYLSRESEMVDAVRDAARVGASAPAGSNPGTLARARLVESLTNLGFDPDDAMMTTSTVTNVGVGASVLSVEVSLPYSPLIGLVPEPESLGATIKMPVIL